MNSNRSGGTLEDLEDRIRHTLSVDASRAPMPAAVPALPGLRRREHTRVTRPGWRPAIAAGVAVTAVLAGVALLAPGAGQGGGHSQVAPAAPRSEAASFLHNAALVALRSSDPTPRSDQFVFAESVSKGDPTGPWVQQSWLSVDNSRQGLLRAGEQGSKPTEYPLETTRCGSGGCIGGYAADAPTTADAMLAYLKAQAAQSLDNPDKLLPGAPRSPNADELVWKYADGLFAQRYLRPEARAALFEALSRTSGATVEKGVLDAIGRKGVAVGRSDVDRFGAGKYTHQLIFDADTYELLGSRTVSDVGPIKGQPFEGTVAYVRSAIVDEVGQVS